MSAAMSPIVPDCTATRIEDATCDRTGQLISSKRCPPLFCTHDLHCQ